MIEFITYQGERYPIRISYYVLLMAQKETGSKLEFLDSDLESQQVILWYALEAGHKMAKKELTLKREDMVWILDESYVEFQKAMFYFGQSLIEMQQELLEEANNKKK